MKMRSGLHRSVWLPSLLLSLLLALEGRGADPSPPPPPTLSDRLNATTKTVTTEAAEAGRETAAELEKWWNNIEQYRLKNRSPDEITAWILVGLMVGGMAGSITTLRRRGFGLVRNLALGLMGAFLGGLVVHLTRWDLGWGPMLIRYEELAAALAGSVLVVLLFRFLTRKTKHPEPS